jgi:hypothetical protein
MEWMELHEKELTPEQRFQYEMLCGNRRTDTLLLTMNNLLAADAQLQMMNSTTLSNIARALKAVGKQLYVSIPDSGGLYMLQAGTTTIDFVDGKMIIPNGDVQTLRTSLRVQNVEEMRSLVLTTSGQISFSIDGGGFFTLDAGEKFATSDYGFKTIYLDVPAPAYIKMMASTTPELTVMYDRFMSEDLSDFFAPLGSSIYDANELIAQTVNLDLTDCGRGMVEVFGTASSATDFTLFASDDNVHWFTIETENGTSFHYGYYNTFRYVRLTSAVAGVAGDKVSLVLKASR